MKPTLHQRPLDCPAFSAGIFGQFGSAAKGPVRSTKRLTQTHNAIVGAGSLDVLSLAQDIAPGFVCSHLFLDLPKGSFSSLLPPRLVTRGESFIGTHCGTSAAPHHFAHKTSQPGTILGRGKNFLKKGQNFLNKNFLNVNYSYFQ